MLEEGPGDRVPRLKAHILNAHIVQQRLGAQRPPVGGAAGEFRPG